MVLSGRSQLLRGEQHGGRAGFVEREHPAQTHRSMDEPGCLRGSLGLKREDFVSSVGSRINLSHDCLSVEYL